MTHSTAESHLGWVCQQLSLQVSRYFDQGDFERAAALFTEDGEFVRPSTYFGSALNGRAAITAFGATLPKGLLSRHVCSNFVVDVRGEALALCHSLFVRCGDNRLPSDDLRPLSMSETWRSLGEYEERMVRTPEGWRIASRVGRFILGGV